MNEFRVGIVVPVFNAWDFTEKCLYSIAETCSDESVGVVVVDNGSSDHTQKACPAVGGSIFGDRFHYEHFDVNINFGPACNAGAELISADYVFFLNNDTTLEQGWLDPLLHAFDVQHDLGGVGPLLLYPETRRVQHLGVTFSPIQQVEHLFQYFPENHPVISQPRQLQAMNAAAMMLPRSLFLDVGGFDVGYVNGFEDLELSLAIRRQGKSLSCITDSRVLHYESQSEGRFDADDANSERFAERCGDEIVSDMHKHLQLAGYKLDVTPWFDAHAVLPEARANELALIAGEGLDLQGIWELLQLEPLWNHGYNLLAGAFEAAGNWPEATEIRLLQHNLCPSMESLRALALCAGKSGQPQIATQCFDFLRQYRKLLTDPEVRARRFMEINKYLGKQPGEVTAVYRAALAGNGIAEGAPPSCPASA
ncbi:MAG: glycosyltransferase family 2 protein [Proteobacteria bacterium]|nr:glycosyltransferase family 2 protein [Pseudomonadota bacterium]